MESDIAKEITKLSIAERILLVEEIWDSIARENEAFELSKAQKEELDRRLDELDREGPIGIPWNEVLDRIRNRAL